MVNLRKFVFNKMMGWKIQGEFDPEIRKSIIIVVPHTSWHDFYIGLFVRGIKKVKVGFVAKKELFRWPFGWYFKRVGGVPLDRTPGQNKVEAIAEIFKKKDEFRLSLAPEGTRKKVDEWKTGYYYIAMAALIPIIPVAFDYGKKTVFIYEAFHPTGDIEADTRILRAYYEGVVGKVPYNS